MNKPLTWIVSIIVIALVAWGFVALDGGEKSQADETIKIGAVLPLTGLAAFHGENEKKGIDLAVEEINASGGIDGMQIEIVYEDDQTDAKTSIGAVNKLIDVDGVEAIVGGTWDFLSDAIIPVINEKKKVLISPSALPDTVNSESPYFFVTHSPVFTHKDSVSKFLSGLESKRVVLMYLNVPWGLAHLEAFKAGVEEAGAEVVKEVTLPGFDNNDIQTELSLIKPLNPDVTITAIGFGDNAVMARKRLELDVPGAWLAQFVVIDAFNGGTIESEDLEGIFPFGFSAESDAFVDSYKAKYNNNPGTYADTAYDAIYAIKAAVEETGNYDGDSIREGLKKITFQGASGEMNFSEENYTQNKSSVLYQFTDRELVPVE